MKIYLHLDTDQHWALLHPKGTHNNTPPTGRFAQKTGANEQQTRVFEMSRMARVDDSEDMPTASEGVAKNPAKRLWGKYAREIAPKVMILLYLSVGTSQTRLISKQLADKILAGDV